MKLLPTLGRRLLYTLPVVWLVVSLVFLLIHLVPGDPVAQMLGEGATPTDLDTLRHQYGLDLPLSHQYLRYWHGVLHGDLGHSLRLNDSATHLILCRTRPQSVECLAHQPHAVVHGQIGLDLIFSDKEHESSLSNHIESCVKTGY